MELQRAAEDTIIKKLDEGFVLWSMGFRQRQKSIKYPKYSMSGEIGQFEENPHVSAKRPNIIWDKKSLNFEITYKFPTQMTLKKLQVYVTLAVTDSRKSHVLNFITNGTIY